jgi:peptidoglycan/xylan/chitin deacetylase (PgdA/CDA1 family)
MQVEEGALSSFLTSLKAQGHRFRFLSEARTRGDITISFDDGYADNLHVALPLLKKLEIPMTLFLNTDWLDSKKRRWADEVMAREDDPKRARELAWEGYRDESEIAMKVLTEKTGKASPEYPKESRPLTSAEVRELVSSPLVRIEAHGHRHLPHCQMNKEELQKDTEDNLDQIEALTGRRPKCYAYPYGRMSDLAPFTLDVLKKLGITNAYLAEGRPNYPWTHPLLLDRNALNLL